MAVREREGAPGPPSRPRARWDGGAGSGPNGATRQPAPGALGWRVSAAQAGDLHAAGPGRAGMAGLVGRADDPADPPAPGALGWRASRITFPRSIYAGPGRAGMAGASAWPGSRPT